MAKNNSDFLIGMGTLTLYEALEFEYRDATFQTIEREFDAGLKHLADTGWEIAEGVRTIDA